MDIQQLDNFFRSCTIKELRGAHQFLEQRLKEVTKLVSKEPQDDDSDIANRRQESRFKTQIVGVVTRVTDVRPGEPKQFTVTVTNVSRKGVAFQANLDFPYSRIIQLSFSRPQGKAKHTTLEVVRLRKLSSAQGKCIEVGCQSVDENKVRKLKMREERLASIRSKLEYNKQRIFVYIVGPDNSETANLTLRIKQEGYQVRQMTSVEEALSSAEKTSAQLVIFREGSLLARNERTLEILRERPAGLAMLAITSSDEDRLQLYRAGLDECLLTSNTSEFLFFAINRALLGHALRSNPIEDRPAGRGLIIGDDPAKIHLVSFALEEHGYAWRSAITIQEAEEFAADHFNFVLVDYDCDKPEMFRRACTVFNHHPVIAICNHLPEGHGALANGATDYLTMPPKREDVRLVLETCVNKNATAAFVS